MTDREAVLAALREGPVFGGERLSEAGRAELLDAIRGLERRGARVAVVVLPDGEALAPWRSLWVDLGLAADTDLLLLFDGNRWEAKGLGLSSAEIGAALDGAEDALAQDAGRGLAAGIGALGTEAGLVGGAGWSVGLGALGVAGVAVAGGIGWVVWRRTKVAREEDQALAAARAEVEEAVATLVVTADGLGDTGRDLQDRAVRLRDEIKRIPKGESHRQRLGRLQQLENEVVALQSRVAQNRTTREG